MQPAKINLKLGNQVVGIVSTKIMRTHYLYLNSLFAGNFDTYVVSSRGVHQI